MSARAAAKRPRVVPLPAARTAERAGVRHYLSVLDFTPGELLQTIDLAAALKRDRAAGTPHARPLDGKHVALLFEKPSLRTRSTFTIAVRELGGDVIELQGSVASGARESMEDVARNIERWVAGCVVRTFAQASLRQFAGAATRMHVINALTDEEHPCQVLADMLTLREHTGGLRGRTLAFIGDGNNVATSLAHIGARLGVHVRISSPKGYELPEAVIAACEDVARDGATLELVGNPADAVRGADAVYTDAWTSMGQESQATRRERAFQPFQVNRALMAAASPRAIFMHCLPAHRGSEVTDEVMDSPASVIFDQAENRLHTQKALLSMLMS
jgi:ornithine carbamoyltransferase